jgi:hypothetical protein
VTTEGDEAVAYVSPASTATYTVTAMQGCSGSDCSKSITIHVSPNPLVGIIHAAPSVTVCPGTPVTLSVLQTDANKFCWSSSDVGSQFPQPSITVTPKDTTTYYLFGAKDGCYGYRDSITLYLRPSANAGVDATTCLDNSVLIGTPQVTGFGYSWFPATGLSDPNIAQPVATPSVETNYVLTVTDPAAGCSDNDTLRVDPVQCCNGPVTTPVFDNGTTASEFLNTMLNIYGAQGNIENRILKNYDKEIIVNGAFLVDSSLTIQNCTKLKFGEKARVIVDAPKVFLKFQNDSLLACGPFLWSGIINSNLLSNVIIEDTYISGADTAFATQNDADYQVKNSHFHNNRYGIEMYNYVGASWSNPNIIIYGTTFDGDSLSVRGIGTTGVNSVIIGNP